MKNLNKDFWERKYDTNALGWDIGYPSPPLTDYIDQLSNKELKILVPGAGNGYEVAYLFQQGFKNVFVVDIAQQPLAYIKKQLPDIPEKQLIQGNFFNLKEANFDLVLEQTFFCALAPELRTTYVQKMAALLKPKGKIVGLLFDFPLTPDGPPFGGDRETYKTLFSQHFNIQTIATAHNSIKPRAGKELFFIFEHKP